MFIGIDIGSRQVKIVYGTSLEDKKFLVYDTIKFYKNFCIKNNDGFYLDISKIREEFHDVEKIIATGYGKNMLDLKNVTKMSELKAHMLGVLGGIDYHSFILLDIGGQDTKVINVKDKVMCDFFMNDKCAAGSGRYIENMSRVLDMQITEISEYYENPVKLSNTCAIFGESEVVAFVAEGRSYSSIAAGVNYSVFDRVKRYLLEFDNKTVVFVGGVSKNKAVKKYIETELSKTVIIPDKAEYTGAMGCFYTCFKECLEKV